MTVYLLSGLVFGLSAGLAPGPLLTLVLADSVRFGYKAGVRISFAPLITDIPIVAGSLFAISGIAGSQNALGVISLVGAVFVVYLGFETFRSQDLSITPVKNEIQSLRKGIITNLLNPHPYLFWITVGSPMVIHAFSTGAGHAAAFVAGFYTCLVGSKVVLSIIVGRARNLLLGPAYRYCMRLLGLLLWIFAILLAWDAMQFLGLLR